MDGQKLQARFVLKVKIAFVIVCTCKINMQGGQIENVIRSELIFNAILIHNFQIKNGICQFFLFVKWDTVLFLISQNFAT